MFKYQAVEFKSLDGLTLRGRLYPAANRGPAIVITSSFNLVKEIAVPEIAEIFQHNGITALIYDHRNYGDSEGLPRNDVDPERQCEDCSDALSFLASLPVVDPSQIGLWGTSISGLVCLKAAAIDRRFRLVIVVSPFLTETYDSAKVHKFFRRCVRDREAQLRGNDPFRIPLVTETGASPLGFGPDFGVQAFRTLSLLKETIAPNYESEMTIQTWPRVLGFSPLPLVQYLSPTPVMVVIPELDTISPPDRQKELFTALPEPKRLYNAIGKGHIDVVIGDGCGDVIMAQLDFFKDVMSGQFDVQESR